MARASINSAMTDLVSDSGSVLWSVIRGEQLELRVVLPFIDNILESTNFEYEAVFIEGENLGEGAYPSRIRPSGESVVLPVRIPSYQGLWAAGNVCNTGEVFSHAGSVYEFNGPPGFVSNDPPTDHLGTLWSATTMNTIYIQLSEAHTSIETWEVLPEVAKPVYGFFELRITEKTHPVFPRTWKPVRGMIEVRFSPTHLVV